MLIYENVLIYARLPMPAVHLQGLFYLLVIITKRSQAYCEWKHLPGEWKVFFIKSGMRIDQIASAVLCSKQSTDTELMIMLMHCPPPSNKLCEVPLYGSPNFSKTLYEVVKCLLLSCFQLLFPMIIFRCLFLKV